MIHASVEFHNVAELLPTSKGNALRLQRVPEAVRLSLNEAAQMRMLQPDTCEIRFRADGPCHFTLSSEGQTRVTVFHGLFDGRQRYVIGDQPQTIDLNMPEGLKQLDPAHYHHAPFSPHLYRLIFGGPQRDPILFHGIEGENIRPPEAVSVRQSHRAVKARRA